MRKSFGDPICGGLLVDASAVGPVKEIDASMASVPNCLRLGKLLRLSAKTCKTHQPEGRSRLKREAETTLSPRGDSRSAADRRTGYEAAIGPKEIQWLPGSFPDKNQLDKRGGPQGELAEGQERVAWARVSPAVFPPTFGRTARRPLSSPPPAGHSNERKWARRRHPAPGRGTPLKSKATSPSPRALPKENQKPLSARGSSGEVGHPPRRLRGGRRPHGDSAAAGCQVCW